MRFVFNNSYELGTWMEAHNDRERLHNFKHKQKHFYRFSWKLSFSLFNKVPSTFYFHLKPSDEKFIVVIYFMRKTATKLLQLIHIRRGSVAHFSAAILFDISLKTQRTASINFNENFPQPDKYLSLHLVNVGGKFSSTSFPKSQNQIWCKWKLSRAFAECLLNK